MPSFAPLLAFYAVMSAASLAEIRAGADRARYCKPNSPKFVGLAVVSGQHAKRVTILTILEKASDSGRLAASF
jgi:hypothetical protein